MDLPTGSNLDLSSAKHEQASIHYRFESELDRSGIRHWPTVNRDVLLLRVLVRRLL